MKKYTQAQLRQLVRLGVAEDYTNKPGEYMDTLRRLGKILTKPPRASIIKRRSDFYDAVMDNIPNCNYAYYDNSEMP